jgi:hypothetical protein
MRLRFDDVDDEKAAEAARRRLVHKFERSLGVRPGKERDEVGDVDFLLDWKFHYGDGDFGRWTRADVDEVLLEHLPRKLSASPEEAASFPASIAAFVRFLAAEGLLDAESDPADVVVNRALAQQRAFLDAMADPRNFGMAKRLFASMDLGPDDVPDQAALDAAVARFNTLPFEERGKILGLGSAGFDGGVGETLTAPAFVPLPLRAFPSATGLDARAADVVLVRQVDALADALGTSGIKLTKAGNPTLADTRRLVAATGVGDKVDGIRSSAELSELFAVGRVAVEAGAVEVRGGRLRAVEGWAGEQAGARWQRVVDAVLDVGAASLQFGAVTPMPWELADLADEGAAHFLAVLWLAREPLPLDALVDMLESAANLDRRGQAAMVLGPETRRTICRDRMADVLVSFVAAGLVTVDDDEHALLTDAGARLVTPALVEAGFDVVQPEQLAGLDAGGLLDVLAERDETDVAVAVSAWADGRTRTARAAAEALVAELVARPEPVRLMVGFAVLDQIGEAAVEAVRAALDTPIAAHAWMFLIAAGEVDHAEMPRHLVVEAAVDLFLATADAGSPADVVESVLGHLPEDDHTVFLDELAMSDHPRAAELLDLLGRHHPVKEVAKHARKAAHRRRSAQDPPR